MRYPPGETAEKHQKILDVASRMFRERGIGSVSIAEIMKAAGLTHGAFYAHFPSKDALAAEAVGHAMEKSESERQCRVGEGDPLLSFAESYLTEAHRDNPGDGCTIAALGPSVARNPDIAGPFTDQVKLSFAHLAAGSDQRSPDEARRKAIHAVSAAVGAVIIARAVDDPALSDEVLESVRKSLSISL